MKTPVTPDHDRDEQNLISAYSDPAGMEKRKMFPGTDFEFQQPTAVDIIGFLICVAACFAIVGAAVFAARLGQ